MSPSSTCHSSFWTIHWHLQPCCMDSCLAKDTFFSSIVHRLNSCTGYQFVVQFLRFFLAPIYEIHEVRQIGDQEILVKWSWTMNFWWNRYNPLKIFWDPRLAFTGTTVLGYDKTSGKHCTKWVYRLQISLLLTASCNSFREHAAIAHAHPSTA